MFRAFALAAISAVNARKVHEFFAENNYKCELCQQIVEYAKEGKDDEMDMIYRQFPSLLDQINSFYPRRDEIVDYSDPLGTCQRMELCEDPDIFELLFEEQPLDLSEHINATHATWVSGVNEKFEGASLKEVKSILGAIVDPEWAIKLPARRNQEVADDLPASFDARAQWPKCNDVINHIRDQSNCGSCWAHGTTEALNDRACIASDGAITKLYSVADTTACCNFLHCQSMGCNGGQVGTPWKWFENTGVVSGGDFGDGKLCFDYTMAKCAHHVTSETLPGCDDIKQVQPKCESTCQTNSSINYSSDKNHSTSSYGINSIDEIKTDIFKYGTVTAAFTVHEDFLTYKSGVY